MKLLDNFAKIRKIDKNNAFGSIQAVPKQLEAAWRQAQKIEVPPEATNAKNIIVAGMGGSALGARVIKSLYERELRIPLLIRTEYQLPEFVNQDSLVIIASYSGNTEETLSCLEDALQRKAKIFAYTTGGHLGEKIKTGKIKGLIFKPKLNPLGFPKTAIGYSIGLILGVLARFNYLLLEEDEFFEAVKELKKINLQKPAQEISRNILGKIPIFIASEPFVGALHAFRNQINEIAHTFSVYFDLPEMNHHLVEGFASPEPLKKNGVYYFFNSQFYQPPVEKRYPLTQEILTKLEVTNFEYHLQAKTILAQAFELVNLGGWTAFCLSLLKNEDPGPEPWILYLKKRLASK